MSEQQLLTGNDVEVKVFKKVRFGGYDIQEVEDFLNQLADDLDTYEKQLSEKTARVEELEGLVKKQDSMTDAIKDALIQARKAAQDMEDQASANAEKIISDAKTEAQKHTDEAEEKYRERLEDARRKAADIVASAESRAADILHSARETRNEAEKLKADLEERLQGAKDEAEEIVSSARVQAKDIISGTENEVKEYQEQLNFLSMRKQQFVKNTVSLLLDFGKLLDKAQADLSDELDGNLSEEDQKQRQEQEQLEASLEKQENDSGE